MRAGHFNLNDYLSTLNESQEAGSVKDSGEGLMIQDGESKKAYDWLKKEYTKGKTEVKVEMKMGGQKFEPSMDFQTDLKSIKNFKSGIFGQVKTSDTEGNNNKGASALNTDTDDDTNESGEDKSKVKAKKEKGAESVKFDTSKKKKKADDKED